MTDLERSLSASHDPADWSILADWHEEHGNVDEAARWRERARVGRQILDRLLQLASPVAGGGSRYNWFGPVWLQAWRVEHTAMAQVGITAGPSSQIREVMLASVRIHLTHLRLCRANRHASQHVARALRKLVDAVLD